MGYSKGVELFRVNIFGVQAAVTWGSLVAAVTIAAIWHLPEKLTKLPPTQLRAIMPPATLVGVIGARAAYYATMVEDRDKIFDLFDGNYLGLAGSALVVTLAFLARNRQYRIASLFALVPGLLFDLFQHVLA